MKTQEEIGEKIEVLNDKIAGLRAEGEDLNNELKVILAGSELQSIMLTSTLVSSETQVRDLLEKFEQRAEELTEKYEEASIEGNVDLKNQIHAMIWTNDIRLDTLKWVLEEEDEEI
jgi:predicted DNA-binding protein with PD1-like motif